MPLPVPEVASRARTENFPIASLLFPREHRPHLRADLRLRAARGHPRRRVGGRPAGGAGRTRGAARRLLRRRRARMARHARAEADDRGLRAAEGAVRPADRGESDGPADLGVRELGRPSRVLPPLGRPRRPARAGRHRARGRHAARRLVGRRLHGSPARELPPGRAARPGSRTRVPPGRGPPPLPRHRARPAEQAADAAARVRGGAGGRAAGRGRAAARGDRRAYRQGGRALRPRRTGGARRASRRAVGRLHGRPRPSRMRLARAAVSSLIR